MNIIQAMKDKALFARWFSSGSWQPWTVFLKALFALPMDDAPSKRAAPSLHRIPPEKPGILSAGAEAKP